MANEMLTKFEKGNRVFYRDNGPESTGTITEVHIKKYVGDPAEKVTVFYTVKWDDGDENGEYYGGQMELVV